MNNVRQVIAGFAGILDTSFLMPVIALYSIYLGASPATAGIIVALYSIAAIPASIIAGGLVDRFGRKRTLTFGLTWDAVMVLLYGLVSSYSQLALLRVLHAFGGSLVFPALFSMARESKNGHSSIVRILSAMAVAIAIGSAMGGVLTSAVGYRMSFIIISFIMAFSAFMSLDLPETMNETTSLDASFRQSRSKIFLGVWTIFFLYTSLGILVGGLAPALVVSGVVEEKSARVLMGAGIGIASLIAGLLFFVHSRLINRFGEFRVASYSSAVSFFGLSIFLLRPSTAMVLFALLMFGVALSGLMLVITFFVTDVPKAIRGKAVGLQQVSNILGVSIGAPIGGFLSVGGPFPVVLSSGLALLIGGLGIYIIKPKN
ncbi:MFS transporter [Thermococcus sp.]